MPIQLTRVIPHLLLAVTTLVLGFVVPQAVGAQAILENPTFGSFQSGIDVISGWKCMGGILTFTIDNGPEAQLAYGTSRLDTQAVCGDSDNAFSYLMNWNLLSTGWHTIRVYERSLQ